MKFQLHRRMMLSWLVIATTLMLTFAVGTLAIKASAAPLVANLSTSTLMVDKTVARNGETLNYTLLIKNSGDTNASDIIVTTTLPSELTYMVGSILTPPAAGVFVQSVTVTGNDIVWKGLIQSGQQASVKFAAVIPAVNTVPTGTVLTDTATIDHTSGQTNLSAVTTVVAAAPDMSGSTKSADKDEAKIGDTIHYTVMLANSGDADGLISLTDTIPAQLTYVNGSVSAPPPNGAIISSFGVTGGVVHLAGQIPPGRSAMISFDATVNAGVADGTIITNTVQINDGTAITERMAATTVVSQTGSIIFLPLVFKAIPAPVLQISSVTETGGNASWTVSWNNVLPSNGEIYEVQEATNASFTQNVNTQTTTSLSKSYSHPASTGITYYYRVRVTSGIGSAYSGVKSVALTSNLTADVLNLNSDAGDCTTLRWDFPNISSIYMNYADGFLKRPTSGTGTFLICPSRTTKYEAEITYPDGRKIFPSVTVNVTGSNCNRDPYINRWDATAYNVPINTDITIFWDVQCATEIHQRLGGDSAPTFGVSGSGSREFRITGDTSMNLIVKSASQAHGDFNETSTFVVFVNNREEPTQK
ncbi:MAG TPA: DUF11 domain-containing protein [Gammaproteobacteria bacterium]|nr:DUF11 domain-containing protein [Gammaproteobacteria bacterium]